MSFDVSQRSRVRAGVRTGGQFTTEERAETAVTLTVATGEPDTYDTDRYAWAGDLPLGGTTEERRVIHTARSSVRQWVRKKAADLPFGTGIREDDLEDLVSETVARAWATRKGGETPSWKWIGSVAHNVVNDHIRGSLRGEEFRARLDLERRLTADIMDGKRLSATQVAQAAAMMRETWHDQRHRPSADFHTRQRQDVLTADGQVRDVARRDVDSVPEDSPIGQVLAAADGGAGRFALVKQVRGKMWQTFTSRMDDVPDPLPLGRPAAREVLLAVEQDGGARAVALRIERGEKSEGVTALLGAFGDPEGAQERGLASALLAAGDYADDLLAEAFRRR